MEVELEEAFANLKRDAKRQTIDKFLRNLPGRTNIVKYYIGSLYWIDIKETDFSDQYKEAVTNIYDIK